MRVTLSNDSVWFDVIGEKERVVDGRRVEKPTMIFVHGGGGNHSMSRPLAHRFADVAQCVILDLPGHGRSSVGAADRWSFAAWADVLAEFADTLDIRRPVLHGGSMGGFVVLATALRHPELAGGLVLMSTAARRDKELSARRFAELGGDEALAAYRTSLTENAAAGFPDYLRACIPLYSTRHRAETAAYLARYSVLGPTELATLAVVARPGGDFDSFDARAGLAAVRTPTLVIAGALDPVMPVEGARELHASFARGAARLVEIDDASHFVPEDAPELYDRAVRTFLAEQEPA